MLQSSLSDSQRDLGATFGLYYDNIQLPSHYSTVHEEYSAARNAVVLMDRSCFGELRVSGTDHVDLLHRITTNELRNLKAGSGQVNLFTNEKGRIVSRVRLLKLQEEIRLLGEPFELAELEAWIFKYVFIEDVVVEDFSDKRSMVSLFGPNTLALLNVALDCNVQALTAYGHRHISWKGVSLQVLQMAEIGVPNYHLRASAESIPVLWEHLLSVGAPFGLKPMGEEAYSALRIEAGWPQAGRDFTRETNPHEANMFPYVNFDKGCYIGQEVVARLDTYQKVQRRLIGLVFDESVKSPEMGPIYAGEKEIGCVTSITESIPLGSTIALGQVKVKHLETGKPVYVRMQGLEIPAKMAELPFGGTT